MKNTKIHQPKVEMQEKNNHQEMKEKKIEREKSPYMGQGELKECWTWIGTKKGP